MSKLSLKAVTELLGITEHNLRAWERRYGAVTPVRDDNGRRVYSFDDVERLRLLMTLVNRGHAIGNIAKLEMNALEKMIEATSSFSDGRQARFLANHPVRSYLQATLEAVGQVKWPQVAHLLQRAELQFDTRQFLIEYVSPLLQKIGEAVETGELDIFHEHAMTALLRQQLNQQLFPFQSELDVGARDILVFATPSGDWHEFGILMAAVLATLNGYGVFFLGPNMPADSLVRAAISCEAKGAVLGLVCPSSELSSSAINKYLSAAAEALPKNCELILGGSRATDPEVQSSRFATQVFDSLLDFDRYLQRTSHPLSGPR